MNKPLSTILLLLCIISLPFVYISLKPNNAEIVVLPGLIIPESTPISTSTTSIYSNRDYGFSLELPDSWGGYTVATTTDKNGGELTLIRHPLWTKESPRADIPIIVYSLKEWLKWQKTDFAGYKTSAPVAPTERGRNTKYVFVTAARYNFSFLPGFEEVERIITTLRAI